MCEVERERECETKRLEIVVTINNIFSESLFRTFFQQHAYRSVHGTHHCLILPSMSFIRNQYHLSNNSNKNENNCSSINHNNNDAECKKLNH